MKSHWNRLQINIEPANRAFYQELFTLLGRENWHEGRNMLSMGVEGKGWFWFASASGAEEQKDVFADPETEGSGPSRADLRLPLPLPTVPRYGSSTGRGAGRGDGGRATGPRNVPFYPHESR